MNKKINEAAKTLGSIKSKKKAYSSRINGKLGGYWKHKKNINKAIDKQPIVCYNPLNK